MGIRFQQLARLCHAASVLIVAALAIAVISYTLACAFGFAPWLVLAVSFGDVSIPQGGMYLQIALSVLVGSLFFFMPANQRIMALEQSHRKFHISMEDVARAYHICHAADRAGVFSASSEFDSVRERLAHLRDHPDLEKLEPGVLEVAAQMSQQARQLADVYSDEKVARARGFLQQRQEEVERQQERIVEALHVCSEIRKWAQQVDVEESIIASQLAQLDEKLQQALPALGYSIEQPAEAADSLHVGTNDKTNVLVLQKKPAAE